MLNSYLTSVKRWHHFLLVLCKQLALQNVNVTLTACHYLVKFVWWTVLCTFIGPTTFWNSKVIFAVRFHDLPKLKGHFSSEIPQPSGTQRSFFLWCSTTFQNSKVIFATRLSLLIFSWHTPPLRKFDSSVKTFRVKLWPFANFRGQNSYPEFSLSLRK